MHLLKSAIKKPLSKPYVDQNYFLVFKPYIMPNTHFFVQYNLNLIITI